MKHEVFWKNPGYVVRSKLKENIKCDYLIVDLYCLNTLYAMKNVGIKIHKIPPFVKTAEEAINHFAIGTEIAEHLRYVHPVA